MKAAEAQSLRIELGPGEAVSALLIRPPQSRACYVFAHGAGAGMTHASMETVAAELGRRGIATLRYQFPYMEKAASGPMRRRWRMRRSAPPRRKPDDAAHRCR